MMKTHLFRASSLKEAIVATHSALGPNATITDMRTLRSGNGQTVIGFEVTARGTKQQDLAPDPCEKATSSRKQRSQTTRRSKRHLLTETDQNAIKKKLRKVLLEVNTIRECTRQWQDSARTGDALRKQISDTYAQFSQTGVEYPIQNSSPITSPPMSGETSPSLRLVQKDLGNEQLVQTVAHRLNYLPGNWLREDPSAMALVGPTGVGKTTVLFKIAGLATMRYQRTVSVVTLDAHRPGRAEAHARFAGVLGISHHIVRDPRALPSLMNLLAPVDLVLIDTPGHNPWESAETSPITDALLSAGIDLHVVAPATWSAHDLEHLISLYSAYGAQSVIASRIDQARSLRDLVHALAYTGLPLSAISLGDDVSGVIHPATPESVKALLRPSLNHAIPNQAIVAG